MKSDMADLWKYAKEYKSQPEHTKVELPYFFKQQPTEVERWSEVKTQSVVIISTTSPRKIYKLLDSIIRMHPLGKEV